MSVLHILVLSHVVDPAVTLPEILAMLHFARIAEDEQHVQRSDGPPEEKSC